MCSLFFLKKHFPTRKHFPLPATALPAAAVPIAVLPHDTATVCYALLYIVVVLVIWMVHRDQTELCEALLGANLKNDGQGRLSVERIMVLSPVAVKLVVVPRVPVTCMILSRVVRR